MQAKPVSIDKLNKLDWYGFGFKDGRVYGHTEMEWSELAKELTLYEPLSIREDGLVMGTRGNRQVALIKGKVEDYADISNRV